MSFIYHEVNKGILEVISKDMIITGYVLGGAIQLCANRINGRPRCTGEPLQHIFRFVFFDGLIKLAYVACNV